MDYYYKRIGIIGTMLLAIVVLLEKSALVWYDCHEDLHEKEVRRAEIESMIFRSKFLMIGIKARSATEYKLLLKKEIVIRDLLKLYESLSGVAADFSCGSIEYQIFIDSNGDVKSVSQ